jgi:2-haloacid dehalogenase
MGCTAAELVSWLPRALPDAELATDLAARRSGLDWDAVISCEMIGACKPQPQAYRQAARW